MNVLVAYDGGEASQRIVGAIASWARTSEGELQILEVLKSDAVHQTAFPGPTHALTPAGLGNGTAVGPGEPFPRMAESRAQAIDRMRAAAADDLRSTLAPALKGIHATMHAEFADNPADAIVELAARLRVDFIAIGSHAHTGVQHALLGSVAERVIRTANVPVLVAGPNVPTQR